VRKILDPFVTAWIGVTTHKLRSFLTTLGIVIGITSVITLMSVGRGATADILSNIESIGADLITVRAGSFSFGGVRGGTAQTLTGEDADAIAAEIPYVNAVASTYTTNLQLVVGGENLNTQVTGVTPQYQQVQELELSSGSFFTEYDYQRSANVVVLGANVVETLFGEGVDPVGQQIRMGRSIVRVVGVLESKGFSMMGAVDDAILIPLSSLQQEVAQARTSSGERVVSSIVLTVSDEEQAEYVVDEITTLLRDRHRLGPGVDDDFAVISTQEIAATISQVTGTMTLLLGAIAAISLLVGGIGVMNIMLVSVLERTREIGIRKALGARESDIWGQFLIEAALLTLTGGIIGVILGWTGSLLVSRYAGLNTVISADIVIMAVSVSVGIGLFFGFYPAWSASRLNPIEALRSE